MHPFEDLAVLFFIAQALIDLALVFLMATSISHSSEFHPKVALSNSSRLLLRISL
jgi:hypothetical protein